MSFSTPAMRRPRACVGSLLLRASLTVPALGLAPAVAAGPPPVAAFARIPRTSEVRISPDGHRIVYLTGFKGLPAVVADDLDSDAAPKLILESVPKVANVEWCRFKTPTRVVCGYQGTTIEFGTGYYPVSRLVAVDVDGKNQKVLVQNTRLGASQYQDQVLDWLPNSPDKVLIELREEGSEFPAVFELDINTSALHRRVGAHPPIRSFTTDASGEVRLGCGYRDTTIQCFTREPGGTSWRQLTKYEVFKETAQQVYRPVAFGTDPNSVYAIGAFEGRDALWRIDLKDLESPQLEFMHPAVDVDGPITALDGRLLGVRYESDRPAVYYVDPDYAAQMTALGKALPDQFASVVSRSADDSRQIIATYADVDGGTYYLLDRTAHRLRLLGREYPELDPKALARMESISYAAGDGTRIPGYLTVPRGIAPKHLPLIVMPHGGPRARDRWEFFFLQQFLVSSGYAVLQMNFRGSSGYGDKWFYAAHQDWGGLTYSDIADGTRWAISSGIADPDRICIVGWSFGGYAALLAAVRDGKSYRCAVSIAGVSDLSELRRESEMFSNSKIVDQQIGLDRSKLKAASPARHAADAATPILMVHGTHDWQVDVEQSKNMGSSLKWANKPHELILLDGEGHQIDGEAARTHLLEAVARFIRDNMGPGVVSPPS